MKFNFSNMSNGESPKIPEVIEGTGRSVVTGSLRFKDADPAIQEVARAVVEPIAPIVEQAGQDEAWEGPTY